MDYLQWIICSSVLKNASLAVIFNKSVMVSENDLRRQGEELWLKVGVLNLLRHIVIM